MYLSYVILYASSINHARLLRLFGCHSLSGVQKDDSIKQEKKLQTVFLQILAKFSIKIPKNR